MVRNKVAASFFFSVQLGLEAVVSKVPDFFNHRGHGETQRRDLRSPEFMTRQVENVEPSWIPVPGSSGITKRGAGPVRVRAPDDHFCCGLFLEGSSFVSVITE
jgi:hypothetical protein